MAQPVQIQFADPELSLTVFPEAQRYASPLPEAAQHRLWDAQVIALRPLPPPQADDPVPTLPLTTLCWVMRLQQARQQLAADAGLRFQRVRLQSWPALHVLPDEWLTPAARVCALLGRKPTTVSLIPLLLELPPDEVLVLVEALRLNGHIEVLGQGSVAVPGPAVAAPAPAVPDVPSAPSLIGKLWQRLGAGLRRQGPSAAP